MNRIRKKYLPLLLILLTTGSFTQPDEYHYRRQIKGVTGTWNKITLPDEMFGKINPDLNDLRILGFNSKGDTIEVPYITEVAAGEIVRKMIPFTVLNQTKNDNGSYFTFDARAEEELNEINLVFHGSNFDWHVTLSGSMDQKEWFTITSDYRIVSVKNGLASYSFTTLKFPTAKYRYYRLLVPAPAKPQLTGATMTERQEVHGAYRQYPVVKSDIRTDKKEKQTVIDLDLPQTVPVSYLHFMVHDKFDYYRPVTIEYLSDSFKTEKGWDYNYTGLVSGTLSSVEPIEFKFGNTFVSKLRITIRNADNEPLHPDSFVVKGNLHQLYARFTQPVTACLLYGNTNAPKPDYDIEKFKDSIPAGIAELNLGPEEAIAKPTAAGVKSLFENKAWLWGIMAVIILLLGWFSLRMMKGKD